MALAGLAVIAGWLFLSFYTVRQEERSVELLFGQYHRTGQPGLNFAPWPFVTKEVFSVTGERTLDIGAARGRGDDNLMLTRDENLVDTEFQVVWNISDPDKYLFNLADDERERANRAPVEPDRLQAMRAAWEAWNASMPAIPDDATVSLGYSAKDMPQR